MDRSSEGKQENDSLVIMTTLGFKRGVGILAQQTSTNPLANMIGFLVGWLRNKSTWQTLALQGHPEYVFFGRNCHLQWHGNHTKEEMNRVACFVGSELV